MTTDEIIDQAQESDDECALDVHVGDRCLYFRGVNARTLAYLLKAGHTVESVFVHNLTTEESFSCQ